jgi:ParB-like chromosome segregation protein Spo0J
MSEKKKLTAAEFLAFAQSAPRRAESPIDEAKRYSFMLRNGFNIHQLCDRLSEKCGRIYRRLRLLKLSIQVQRQVHEGRISMTEALRNKTPQS